MELGLLLVGIGLVGNSALEIANIVVTCLMK